MRTKQELSTAIRERRRAALVVNAHSRRGRRLYDTVHSRLRAAGFTLLGAYPVDRPGELDRVLAEVHRRMTRGLTAEQTDELSSLLSVVRDNLCREARVLEGAGRRPAADARPR